MACGCNDKSKPTPKPASIPEPIEVKPSHLAITCGCGLMRLLPTGMKEGDTFTLVPCPRCSQGLRGKFVGNGVQEVI